MFGSPWILAVLVVIAPPSPDGGDQHFEAESLYFSYGAIAESPVASGGHYVTVAPGGALALEVETSAGSHALVLRMLDVLDGATLSVKVNEAVSVTMDVPAIASDQPIEVSIDLPSVSQGTHVVWVNVDPSTSGSVGFDCCTLILGPDCSGCDLAPMAAPVIALGRGKKVSLPAIPGVGTAARAATTVYRAAWGSVEVNTAGIQSVTITTGDGECEMKPPATGGGPDTCSEKTPCKVTSTIKFKANNYLRFPFTDSKETVVAPDGTSEDFARQGIPFTRSRSLDVPCGTAKNVTWTFEGGGVVTSAASCNKCK